LLKITTTEPLMGFEPMTDTSQTRYPVHHMSLSSVSSLCRRV